MISQKILVEEFLLLHPHLLSPIELHKTPDGCNKHQEAVKFQHVFPGSIDIITPYIELEENGIKRVSHVHRNQVKIFSSKWESLLLQHGTHELPGFVNQMVQYGFILQRMCTLGEETINTPMYIQMDINQCHIMTDICLRRYTLIGEPSMAGKAVKILRLAAFAPAVASSIDYNVRVYFVEDTGDALEVRSLVTQCNITWCMAPLQVTEKWWLLWG